MENKLINKCTTEAFKLYAHEIFQRQIELRIDDEAFDFKQGYLSELNLRRAITDYLAAWLKINMIRWDDLKNSRLNKEKIGEYEFETYAKLYYCGDMLNNLNCVAGTDLDVANMLMSLQYRMLKDKAHVYQGKIFADTSFEGLQERPIYKYLKHATKETSDLKTSYDEIFEVPVEQLADDLFERIVTLQHKSNKTVILPIVDPYYNGKYTRDWKYKRLKSNNLTTSEALDMAKTNFSDWLDVNLREQELGKSLSC